MNEEPQDAAEEIPADENAEDRSATPADETGASPDGSEEVTAQAEPEGVEEPPNEVEQLTAQAAEYLDGWQRARAELANYKKRVERERREAYTRAAGDILTQYLEIVDDLQRALEDRPQEGDAAVWADGIELVMRKLQTLLETHGVETIDAAGKPFDPNYHDAISHEEVDDTPEGHVIDIVKDGYRMGDRVLRAALVRVAK